MSACCVCGRQMGRSTKLTHAWTRDGRYLGQGHRGCVVPASPRLDREIIGVGADDYDEARRYTWSWHIAAVQPKSKARCDAALLFARPDKREDLLTWWRTGPLALPVEYLAEVRVELARMDREYAAWGEA